jgi:hypothetical protein
LLQPCSPGEGIAVGPRDAFYQPRFESPLADILMALASFFNANQIATAAVCTRQCRNGSNARRREVANGSKDHGRNPALSFGQIGCCGSGPVLVGTPVVLLRYLDLILLQVRDLRQEADGHFIVATLNKGDVRVSRGDAELIQRVLARSDAELQPLISTRDSGVVFPVPEAIPVEIDDPA